MKKKFLKIIPIALGMMLCIFCMTVQTFGYASIDMERKTSLTLVFGMEKAVFPGVTFRLYPVADEMVSVADAETYIAEKKIAPVAEKITDAGGIVTFDGLQYGRYLVVGDSYHAETESYTPVPFVVALPQLVPELDTWEYEVVAHVKYTVTSAKLPQTGLLWWPVMFMVPGFAMVIAGVVILKKNGRKTTNAKIGE